MGTVLNLLICAAFSAGADALPDRGKPTSMLVHSSSARAMTRSRSSAVIRG